MKELWWCRIKADTYTMSGKRRRLDRNLPSGNFKETLLATIDKLDKPWEFYGVTIHVITPIHHNTFVIDPDTREITNIG